jgi:hypothetical protein
MLFQVVTAAVAVAGLSLSIINLALAQLAKRRKLIIHCTDVLNGAAYRRSNFIRLLVQNPSSFPNAVTSFSLVDAPVCFKACNWPFEAKCERHNGEKEHVWYTSEFPIHLKPHEAKAVCLLFHSPEEKLPRLENTAAFEVTTTLHGRYRIQLKLLQGDFWEFGQFLTHPPITNTPQNSAR